MTVRGLAPIGPGRLPVRPREPSALVVLGSLVAASMLAGAAARHIHH